jgi:cell division protein FtsZ
MIYFDTSSQNDGAKIKVIGVGGGGGNAINNMIEKNIHGVEFIAANTDRQALDKNKAETKIHLGANSTRGLGAGANPDIGKEAVEISRQEIIKALEGSDMVFIAAGMGGGTGTGGAPTIAKIAKEEIGALVVAIVTTPFTWEGKKRYDTALRWIEELKKNVDSLIVIPNERLRSIMDKNTTFLDSFRKVDDVLYDATRSIAEVITCSGLINVDFADVKTTMTNKGNALIGIGEASGEDRAIKAVQSALKSDLIDNLNISSSKNILVNVTCGIDASMPEIDEIMSTLRNEVCDSTEIIFGCIIKTDEEFENKIVVTLVATGFEIQEKPLVTTATTQLVEEVVATIEETIEKPVAPKLPEIVEEKVTTEPQRLISTLGLGIRSPKGHNELSNLEKPAALRRNVEFTRLSEVRTNTQSVVIDNSNIRTKQATIAYSENPGFLRRILD